MDFLTLPAYAKINLFLDIKNLREDGFHNLEMVMQSIKLHDNVRISKNINNISIDSNSKQIPLNENNLAYKAAEAVIKKVGLNSGINIYIEKNIPIAAGLAGGSTDAAAVIKGMNQLYNLNMDKKIMFDIAKGIGSDVPFCLFGGTVFATGKGDKLKKLKPLREYKVILVKPSEMVSTKKTYNLYDEFNINLDIPVQKLLDIINNDKELDISDGWKNVLEPITKKQISNIEKIEGILIKKGLNFTMMTGSGPTVFSIIKKNEEKLAKDIVKNWPRKNDFITLTQTINFS